VNKLVAVVGLGALISCGTHLTSIDAQRAQNMTDEFVSIQHDIPDSGPVRLKTQSGYCVGQSLLKSAGVSSDAGAGAFQCPKQ
jgi:hypothetical protein